ncbi:MAG: hypothetical protein HYV34_02640 [Candidatus Kerfeldbacteria bacterium]|nr:hypothetical protein [Candidatus Kerfeldbacteria bacterium]
MRTKTATRRTTAAMVGLALPAIWIGGHTDWGWSITTGVLVLFMVVTAAVFLFRAEH